MNVESFFVVLALFGLPPKFDSVCNQIISGTIVLSYDIASEFVSLFLTFLESLLNFQQMYLPFTPTLLIGVDGVEIMVNVFIATIVNRMAILC